MIDSIRAVFRTSLYVVVGFAAGIIVNQAAFVLLWQGTPLGRLSWSVPMERNIEILIIFAYIALVLTVVFVAARQLRRRGFQPTTALLFGFAVASLGRLLLGLWLFANLAL